MKYKSEAEFVRSLSTRLKIEGFDVTRVESHGTSRGIPDMFVQGHGYDFWIEAKNGKNSWRPGQIAFAYRYYLEHRKNKCTVTLRSTEKGIEVYPMTSLEPEHATIPWGIWSKLSLRKFFKDVCAKLWTGKLRDCAITYAQVYEVDYDPDAYWEQEQLEQEVTQAQMIQVMLDCIELEKNQK